MSNTRAPQSDRTIHWLEWLGLGLVLALAGVFRLGWPGINSFGFDEARVSLSALEMAREGQIPSVGIPSSAGVPNPPFFIWLMSLPFALSRDPLFATQCIALVNTLAVIPLWSMARRAWGPWAALTAGLLYASAPYGVLYSRSIWSQDLMAPVAILWAWLGWRSIETRHYPLLALHIALAGLAWQVHYSGAALIPATVYLLVRYRLWRLPAGAAAWWWVLAGAALPLGAALPFAIALYRSGTAASSVAALLSRPSVWSLDAMRLWMETGTGFAWEWLPLGWDWRWSKPVAAAQVGAVVISGALITAGLMQMIRRMWSERRETCAHTVLEGTFLAWALAAPALFSRSSTPVYHQYLLTALPALALLGGRAAFGPRRWQGPLVASLVLIVATVNGGTVAAAIGANAVALHAGGMGTPLLYPRALARAMGTEMPVYSHARSEDPAYDADAAAMSVLLLESELRLVNGDSALLLPPEGETAHLLFLFPDSPALDAARGFAQVLSEKAFPRRSGEPPYTVLVATGLEPEGLAPVEEEQVLDNGLSLVAWSARRTGDSLNIVTCWRVTDAFVPGRYHQFNHLVVGDTDRPVAVQDAPLSSGAWDVGNTVVSWATFDVQAIGPLYLQVGMYAYPELIRILLEDGRDSIRLGPIP